MNKAIIIDGLSLCYDVEIRKKGKVLPKRIRALDDISLEVKFGEVLGIIGENGSGKSTLLKLIAGLLKPDQGQIIVNGRAAGILELGAGFDRELTGRENIELLAIIYGFSKKEVSAKVDNIIAFADLGEFIDAPVKYYSSGMFVRLAFSIAIHLEPEILLIDDTLAIGDEEFQRKCLEKVSRYRQKGKTIICVSHALSYLETICERILLLEKGRLTKVGLPQDVISFYLQNIGRKEKYKILAGDLNLIFNRGRIHINFKNKLITAREGIYFLLHQDRGIVESFKLSWSLVSKGENSLRLQESFSGIFFDINYNWENKEIRFSLDGQNLADVEWRLFLSPEYERWFSEVSEGRFSGFDFEKLDWQHIYHSQPAEQGIILLSDTKEIPAVMLTSGGGNSYFDIFNSDLRTLSRITIIKNFNTNQRDSYSYFKMTMGNNSLLENFKRVFLSTVEYQDLRLNFREQSLSIFWRDKKIVSNLILKMFDGATWHSSYNFEKMFLKKENNHWQILFRSSGLDIKFILNIKFQHNAILFDVERILAYDKTILSEGIDFFITPEYKKYFLQDRKGEFSEKFLNLPYDHIQGCSLSNQVLLQADSKEMPCLLLEKDNYKQLVQLLNSDYHDHSRIVTFTNSYPEELIQASGASKIFNIRILFYDHQKSIEPVELIKPFMIKNDIVKIDFRDNLWIPSFRDVKFSKNWHLYSSLKVNSSWYDSTRVNYSNIQLVQENIIEAKLNLREFPVAQVWRLELRDNRIIWNVVLEILEKLKIDKWQLNLMLSELYSHWFVISQDEKEYGKLFDFKNVSDDWDQIKRVPETWEIGLESDWGNLPRVSLKFLEASLTGFLAITNSNSYFRARLLQWVSENITGRECEFKGEIKIGG